MAPWDNIGFHLYLQYLPGGLLATAVVTVVAVTIGIVEGILLAVGRLSGIRPIEKATTWLVNFGRGLPLLPLLFLVYFGFLDINLPLPPLIAGTLTLGVNVGFYMAELFRSGIQAVPRGHSEVGYALGMSRLTVQRRIVLPQAVRTMLPAIGQFTVGTLINSSFVSAIGGAELTGTTRNIIDLYFATGLWWVLAGTYFILSFPLSRLLAMWERRLRVAT
jgi:His/Glu/Gln/Arg/opine family amino acid ABC transporter permease subunit